MLQCFMLDIMSGSSWCLLEGFFSWVWGFWLFFFFAAEPGSSAITEQIMQLTASTADAMGIQMIIWYYSLAQAHNSPLHH